MTKMDIIYQPSRGYRNQFCFNYVRLLVMKQKIYKSVKFISLLGALLVLSLVACDLYISSYDKFTTEICENATENHVGVVLGTSKYVKGGRINLYYKYRLDAAVELYKSGKIQKVLVSGDNGTLAYNEPRMMFQDLVNAGVNADDIYLDYAGFRTFDSMIRAKKVFNQDKFVIISQQFHNERALFIARNNGIEATAFNAKGISFRFSPKTYIREKLARVKAVLDVHILNTKPKFLGTQIHIS